MSKALMSVEQAKQHLRLDQDDPLLPLYIEAVSEAVINYLKSAADVFLDSAGDVIKDSSDEPVGVPKAVTLAAMVALGTFYDVARAGGTDQPFENYQLPQAALALLYPLRDPALA